MTNAPIKSRARRQGFDKFFVAVCIAAASLSMIVLAVLLTSILLQGVSGLTGTFITGSPSRKPDQAGIWPAMWGTIWICVICAITAVPIGVATAIFLEEFKPRHPLMKKLHGFIQLNIANLAGVPSVVYGILGLTVFVTMFGHGNPNEPFFVFGANHFDQVIDESGQYLLYPVDHGDDPVAPATGQVWTTFDDEPFELRVMPRTEYLTINRSLVADRKAINADASLSDEAKEAKILALEREKLGGVVIEGTEPDRTSTKSPFYFQLPPGRSVLTGGLTLMLVVLPVIIISSQESLRAVPDSLRQGALALGSTRWQTVWKMSLPSALPGIMTGTILSMSRAIGEAAPILIIAGVVFITFTPAHVMDPFTAMPLQIYNWAARPQEDFHRIAASGILVLLTILLSFNALAVFIRYKFQKPLS